MNKKKREKKSSFGSADFLLASSTFANGEFVSRQSHWWTGLEHCFHKNFLMIGQPAIEKVFVSHLNSPVCHGERVVSISEDAGHVFITTDKGRKIKSQYAVAADGARSFVRNALGISFTGTKPEMVWAVLDTFLDTDFPVCDEIITFQLNGQSRVSWIPRERGLARFYVLLEGEGEITRERAEASIKEHLKPYRIDFVRAEWFSTFEGWPIFSDQILDFRILTPIFHLNLLSYHYQSRNELPQHFCLNKVMGGSCLQAMQPTFIPLTAARD